MKTGKRLYPGVLGVLAVLILAGGAGYADCGSIPFDAPVMANIMVIPGVGQIQADNEVLFDPLDVTVFEPGQRALILWNGEEEILLLSTDQRASERSAVLEVIPLPARPSVRLGSFETFEKAQRLMVEKRMWAVAHGGARSDWVKAPKNAGRIDFHKKLGAHDLTVAQVLDGEGFVGFVQDYLQRTYSVNQAPIKEPFVKIIESYIERGFEWFAFDAIVLDDEKNGSREPIEYRFKSDAVFYPMQISTQERGKTKVELLVFSTTGAGNFEGLSADRVDIEAPLKVGVDEVMALDNAWNGFFPGADTLVMDQWRIKGDIARFTEDVVVR